MTIAAWVVVVSVDRKHRDGDVDVGVLVVDVREGTLEDFGGVTEKLELAGLHAETVLSERAHDLVHGLARWLVIVEQVATEEDHIDIPSAGKLHNLVKCAPAVIFPDRVSLLESHVVVGRDQDADRI